MAAAAAPRILEEDSVDVVFHGASYSLSLSTYEPAGGGEPALGLDLEDLASGASWHGEFTASYIESVTGKTGSFKRLTCSSRCCRARCGGRRTPCTWTCSRTPTSCVGPGERAAAPRPRRRGAPSLRRSPTH